MNFDYYIFDLDNCLLRNPNPSEYFDNILLKTLNNFTTNIPNRYERNKFWYVENECDNILKKWGVYDCQYFWNLFDEIDFEYRKILIEKNEIYLYDDVKNVLNQLKNNNKKIAIVSNSADYNVEYIVNKFKLTYFFHEILSIDYYEDQNIAKPSPKGILFILNKLNYNPKNSKALMIGDSIVDIIAAKRANINACLIKRDLKKNSDGYEDWEYLPDYVIECLEDILKL